MRHGDPPVYEMTTEGAWDEDGVAWFPRSKMTRSQARMTYNGYTGVPFIEIRALARYARHAPDEWAAKYHDGEYWLECPADTEGAFPVWRCE